MDSFDKIHRNIVFAKLYGIDFESIDTRGSQYRVEAILSRVSEKFNYLLLSASAQQVSDYR